MGKFKKGDRVKAITDGIDYNAGNEFVLTRDGNGENVYFVDNAGDERIRPQEEVEILPIAEAAGMTQDEIGKAREIPGIKSNTTMPTTLTIEAGKYYRTRDGRKVGPMETWPLGGWHADRAPVPLSGGLWDDSGAAWFENSKDSPDLIAVWVEVPQTEPTLIKTPSIVALIDNGQPMPAVRPLLHDSKEDAEKEAHRLSEKHRGKEFGVFILTAKHHAAAIYDHEWQRLAANGNKIGAIKAIRELTGFGLKASKDGLEDWLSRNAA